jgi:membrane associated rhomboid family serine protease
MSNESFGRPQFVFPKPGRALIAVMATLFVVWLMFAIAINWGGASLELFLLFCGNDDALLRGEVWRLLTAPLMHFPQGEFFNILFVLVGFYFLTPSLEQQWGGPRLIRFLISSALFAYLFQLVLGWLLPASVGAKLIPEYWFGATPMLEAVAIAWALSFRGQQVRLMFVLPISAGMLVWFVVGMSVLAVIAAAQRHEGLISPFGGMLAGWLFGGGTPSPMRKLYLNFKLRKMEREVADEKRRRSSRAKKAPFDVIEGGKSGKGTRRGPDGNLLN